MIMIKQLSDRTASHVLGNKGCARRCVTAVREMINVTPGLSAEYIAAFEHAVSQVQIRLRGSPALLLSTEFRSHAGSSYTRSLVNHIYVSEAPYA